MSKNQEEVKGIDMKSIKAQLMEELKAEMKAEQAAEKKKQQIAEETMTQKALEEAMLSDREKILKQKKVKITIPRDRNNPVKHVWVQLNGQEFYLAVGKEIEVPEEIARIWQDSYNRTIEAEHNMEKFNEI